MVESSADLLQLKGVGRILAKRLYDAGFDSFEKIADAGEEELRKVRGITPRSVGSILAQARQLAGRNEGEESEPRERVKRQLSEVRERVISVAESARERFRDQLTGKSGKKLSADIVKMEDALSGISVGGRKRSKRAARALAKAEKRITGLEDATLKKIRKGLKRARKAIQKAT